MLWTSYSFSDIMGFPLLIGHLDLESRASKSAIAIPSWSLDYGCRAYAALTPIWQYLEMWLWNVIMCMFSHVQLFATPWTVAHQTLLSMGFSRQEYWSGFHFLLQGIFPIQGSNYISYVSCIGWTLCLMSPALAGGFFTTRATWEALLMCIIKMLISGPQPPQSDSTTWGRVQDTAF